MTDEFHLIERDKLGNPKVRYCLDPREVTVIRDPENGDAIIGYVWEPVDEVPSPIRTDPWANPRLIGREPSGFIHVPTEDTHRCEPPESDFLRWTRGLAAGTTWRCDCGVVWVVVDVDAVHYGGRTTVAHREWQRETRKQRRHRLGLRWWQKEAR